MINPIQLRSLYLFLTTIIGLFLDLLKPYSRQIDP